MARPKKQRVICSLPRFLDFSPVTGTDGEPTVMCFDEYEVIRLRDLEHLSQEEIARQMTVSRPTVTELLSSAHEKLARMLVEGRRLELRSSSCVVCEIGKSCPRSGEPGCPKRHCCRAECRKQCQKEKSNFNSEKENQS